MNQTSSARRRRRQSGFTLIEIMVVIVILGILVTLFARNVFDLLFTSQVDLAQTKVKTLADSVGLYHTQNRRFPKSLEELTEKNERGAQIEREIPKDPWGNEYELRKGDRPNEYEVVSAGPDGVFDNEDDITSTPKKDK
ncbi:MAG: type II secretion system protein GspG [Planctomycetes bacterium]|nr:type II secretion system protein GspG [Planctomycetota bacterium]